MYANYIPHALEQIKYTALQKTKSYYEKNNNRNLSNTTSNKK